MLVLLPVATGQCAGYDDQRSHRLRETVAYTIAYGVRTAANHARVVKGVRNQLADVEIEDASRDDARTGFVKTSKAKERGTRMKDQERREKVIAHLQEARRILGKVDEPTFWLDYVINAVDDALALLKAQEPITPILDSGLWRCGACGGEVNRRNGKRYCPKCGRAVKWE